MAQLAKLKNEMDKKRIKNNQINNSQSPIILHNSNGYVMYENQNSIFSQDLKDKNSFDEDKY